MIKEVEAFSLPLKWFSLLSLEIKIEQGTMNFVISILTPPWCKRECHYLILP